MIVAAAAAAADPPLGRGLLGVRALELGFPVAEQAGVFLVRVVPPEVLERVEVSSTAGWAGQEEVISGPSRPWPGRTVAGARAARARRLRELRGAGSSAGPSGGLRGGQDLGRRRRPARAGRGSGRAGGGVPQGVHPGAVGRGEQADRRAGAGSRRPERPDPAGGARRSSADPAGSAGSAGPSRPGGAGRSREPGPAPADSRTAGRTRDLTAPPGAGGRCRDPAGRRASGGTRGRCAAAPDTRIRRRAARRSRTRPPPARRSAARRRSCRPAAGRPIATGARRPGPGRPGPGRPGPVVRRGLPYHSSGYAVLPRGEPPRSRRLRAGVGQGLLGAGHRPDVLAAAGRRRERLRLIAGTRIAGRLVGGRRSGIADLRYLVPGNAAGRARRPVAGSAEVPRVPPFPCCQPRGPAVVLPRDCQRGTRGCRTGPSGPRRTGRSNPGRRSRSRPWPAAGTPGRCRRPTRAPHATPGLAAGSRRARRSRVRTARRAVPTPGRPAVRFSPPIRSGPGCPGPHRNGDAAPMAIHCHREPANRSSYTGSLPCCSVVQQVNDL